MPKKGQHQTEEAKRKIGIGIRNHVRTKEHCENISKGLLGHKDSNETRKKKHLARLGDKNPMYGKTRVCSEETRRKISETLTGKTMPELEHHHTKYEEIHGVDEEILVTRSEHKLIHNRLRREGKCNVPAEELAKIGKAAYYRRVRNGR